MHAVFNVEMSRNFAYHKIQKMDSILIAQIFTGYQPCVFPEILQNPVLYNPNSVFWFKRDLSL